jgi:hypothetical protein
MNTNNIIAVPEFCSYYNIPDTFIESLYNIEIIDIVMQENIKCIKKEQINIIEKMMRLHYQLDINFEGLDVINNLLNHITDLQNKIIKLHNKIDFYK